MGNIMKFSMDRLEQRRFELTFDCPNCGSARIRISSGKGQRHIEDVMCPKCGIRVILDGLNITVVNEAVPAPEMCPAPQGKGAIL